MRGVCEERGIPDSKCILQVRLKILEDYLNAHPNPYVKIIPQIPIQSHEHLNTYYQQILKNGGEGVILRHNTQSRGYKLKPFLDAECVVRGYTKGRGKYANKVGAILCEGAVQGVQRLFKIGTGLRESERENPPEVGETITYRFQGYTKGGFPRFPVYLRKREGGI